MCELIWLRTVVWFACAPIRSHPAMRGPILNLASAQQQCTLIWDTNIRRNHGLPARNCAISTCSSMKSCTSPTHWEHATKLDLSRPLSATRTQLGNIEATVLRHTAMTLSSNSHVRYKKVYWCIKNYPSIGTPNISPRNNSLPFLPEGTFPLS